MSEERAQKRRKARKEPELIELSRLTLDINTALIIRLPTDTDTDGLLEAMRAHLPEDTKIFVVDSSSRVEIVQRGQRTDG